ncbi:MAG TPA: magnesium transporter, partial [Bacteroidetes bacterium]|nr:magnesium transporter [Bacteroidota bacterium]
MPIEEKDLKTILDDISYLIAARQEASVKAMLLSLRSEDIAQLINHLKNKEERLYVFKLLDTESASEVIMELDEVVREQLVDHLGMRELAELVDEMDSDDAADFVSELDEEVVDEVLENVEEEDREEVRQLLEHEEDTAGGIMALEIIAVNQSWTVDQVIQEIRRKADEVDDVYNVYVVDDEGKLVGFVTVKDLIIASGNTIVKTIMDRDVLSVPVTMDQEQVANFAKKYDLVSVP